LAKLYLLLGAAHTVVTALTARLWLNVATWAVPVSEPLATFGKNTLRPHLSMQLMLAVVCSQLAAALLILPWVNPLNRWLKQRQQATSEQDAPPVALSSRESLLKIVRLQREGLQRVWELVVKRERTSGRAAEHLFADGRRGIESLLTQLVSARVEGSDEAELRQVGFACLQLQRSFEDLLFRAERFTDRQVALAARGNVQAHEDEQDARLQEMHELLLQAVDAASVSIQNRQRVELAAARAREIRLNALEAKARRAVLGDEDGGIVEQVRLDILELLDAYEGAGNHLYRLAEALGGTLITRRSSHPPTAEAS
jgi:hypothetical protein